MLSCYLLRIGIARQIARPKRGADPASACFGGRRPRTSTLASADRRPRAHVRAATHAGRWRGRREGLERVVAGGCAAAPGWGAAARSAGDGGGAERGEPGAALWAGRLGVEAALPKGRR